MHVALVPVAEGSEEIEFSAIFDILVRAGFDVIVASPKAPANVELSRGLVIHVTKSLDSLLGHTFDVVAIPGGMPGASNLAESKALKNILADTKEAGKWIGAICASPAVVLKPWGFLPEGVKATCYPSFRDAIKENLDECAVVVDSEAKVITADGPAHAVEFGLAIVREILGEKKSAEIADALLFKK